MRIYRIILFPGASESDTSVPISRKSRKKKNIFSEHDRKERGRETMSGRAQHRNFRKREEVWREGKFQMIHPTPPKKPNPGKMDFERWWGFASIPRLLKNEGRKAEAYH